MKTEQTPMKKNRSLLPIAKVLRRNMTRQEKHLWYDFLQHYPIKIYKQRIVGNYIADFYCHRASLVIEIDGAQHYTKEGKAHDKERTASLAQYGLQVLRFTNGDVDNSFPGVCYMIDKTIKERIEKPLSPANAGALPKGEPQNS